MSSNDRAIRQKRILECHMDAAGIALFQRVQAQRDRLLKAMKDIAEHAHHARKHGVAELAFASIRDKALDAAQTSLRSISAERRADRV